MASSQHDALTQTTTVLKLIDIQRKFLDDITSERITPESPLYNLNLYCAFVEAEQYLPYEDLFDILIGIYGNSKQLKIICLWMNDPDFRPNNPDILFVIEPKVPDEIELEFFNAYFDTSKLFDNNKLISWVRVGNYQQQFGCLVGTRFPHVTPVGQMKIPKKYRGLNIIYVPIHIYPLKLMSLEMKFKWAMQFRLLIC